MAWIVITVAVILSVPFGVYYFFWIPVILYSGNRNIFRYLVSWRGSLKNLKIGFFECERDRRLKPMCQKSRLDFGTACVCSRCEFEVGKILKDLETKKATAEIVLQQSPTERWVRKPRTFVPKPLPSTENHVLTSIDLSGSKMRVYR